MSGAKHIMRHFLGFFEGASAFLTPKLSFATLRTMPHYMFCPRKKISLTFRISGTLIFNTHVYVYTFKYTLTIPKLSFNSNVEKMKTATRAFFPFLNHFPIVLRAYEMTDVAHFAINKHTEVIRLLTD